MSSAAPVWPSIPGIVQIATHEAGSCRTVICDQTRNGLKGKRETNNPHVYVIPLHQRKYGEL